jgi:hypothetical protein
VTPRAAVLYTAIALVFIAGLAVLLRITWLAALAVWALLMIAGAAALRWAFRGWNAAVDKSIAGRVSAAAEICLFCRGIDFTADCTCPRRCTAMVCLFGMRPAPKGPEQ